MKSIYLKNYLLMVGMVLMCFLILGIAFISVSYSFIMNDRKDALRATSEVISTTVSAKLTECALDDWDLRMTITTIASAADVDIVLCDVSGTVVSCSDSDLHSPKIGQSLANALFSAFDSSGVVNTVSDLNGFYGKPRRVYCSAVDNPYSGDIAGYLVVSAELSSMVQVWRSFMAIFFFAACFVLILSLIFSLVTAGRQVAPLKEMSAAAKRFAHGDFSARVSSDRRDEFGELAAAFNSMADSLERSEQLRSEFVANISHELKTPMTTISGFAEGILDGTIPPEKQAKYLETISSETRRLSRLVRSMLDLSRLKSLDQKVNLTNTFDISEVIRSTILGLEPKIRAKGLDIDVQLPEENIFACGDADSVTQVAYNLLDNAIKFSYKDSVITVGLWKRGGKAHVFIRNRGDTIPAQELPLIFDRFHKTDKSRSLDKDGVGLGLYIVKTIIDNHGESIYVKSADNVTEFTFTLTLKQ